MSYPQPMSLADLQHLDLSQEPELRPRGFWLDKKRFRRWLIGKPPAEIIGDNGGTVDDNPLARFLAAEGARNPAVWDEAYIEDIRLAGCHSRRLPDWGRKLLRDLPGDRPRGVTAEECLRVLNGVRAPKPGTDWRFTRPELLNPWPGYVYLISTVQGLYKIGRAVHVGNRFAAIDLEVPFPLTLMHTIKTPDCHQLETLCHRQFAAQRVKGEWFRLTPEDVAWLQEISEWPRG